MTAGEPSTDTLFQQAYAELRRLAHYHLRGERSDHTLQPTALVHEAYIRLARHDGGFEGRAHFVAIAARAMRQVLVDWARHRRYGKRGGDRRQVTLVDSHLPIGPRPLEILDLDRALTRLEGFDERKARLAELRILGGLTIEEAAAELGVSTATVSREWRSARAWLAQLLGDERQEQTNLSPESS